MTLKIQELLQLQAEASYVSLNLPSEGTLVLSLYLGCILDDIKSKLKPFEEVKDKFLKEKAVLQDDGSYTIKQFRNEVEDLKATYEDLTEEFKEYLELLNEELDITIKQIPIKHFEVVSSIAGSFKMLHKLVKFD